MERLEQILSEIAGRENVRENEPMKNHTTFRAGGAARLFVTPEDEDALVRLEKACQSAGVSYTVVGNGSNLLVSDSGYDGVIIQLGSRFARCRRDGDVLEAEAGILLSKLARFAYDQGLSGLEFASGIPGSLGGAAVMNAGAYGGEMAHVLVDALVLTESGERTVIPAEQMELGYRSSLIMKRGYTVLKARVRLVPGDKRQIQDRMDELNRRRKEKQPLEYPSAGSTFKRPAGYFAGKLIQDCGLAGFQIGGAAVSEKHCGFVINKDQASARDIYLLCREIQKRVYDRFQVPMEMEVRLLGDFS